ncbi:MAG: fibronectin type III domain-containing protein, partial [Bacteroidales bacterium]|nr:fibronectin type III domain-containing protein [Bacteroidales bacterium]
MKKFLSLIVMAIAFAIQLPAQTTVTVGNENSSTSDYGPIYSNWNNSFSEVIYLASELQAGMITSISYQYGVSTTLADPSPVIYMAEVSRTDFSSPTDYETGVLTQVYSGASVTYSSPGWVTIQLTTPFVYTGSGNLLVAYKSNGRSYVSGRYFKQTSTTDNMMIMNYSDTYATSGTIPSGGNNMRYTRRPNTRFEISPLDEDFCYPPSGAIATNVLSDEATIVWRANENASGVFGLDYKLSDEEDWTTASTSISDTFYTISSLTSLTDYDVRVYGICTADNSTYSSVSFRTAPSEETYLDLPYEQNFDDVENITNWNFSQGTTGPLWYFGTAENNTTDDSGELTE